MANFDQSVFVNCPFDEDFAPILQAIAFCITDLGFRPRVAPENADNAAPRLARIIEIVRTSKFGIHDLSRCKFTGDEFARLNMPFELGLDFSCKQFGTGDLKAKSILVLEENRYDYQRAISDIAGWDIEAHGGSFISAVRHVSLWLIRQTGVPSVGPAKILGNYAAFQEWYWEREIRAGASEDDIKAYPTVRMIEAMQEWVNAGRPDCDPA